MQLALTIDVQLERLVGYIAPRQLQRDAITRRFDNKAPFFITQSYDKKFKRTLGMQMSLI